MNFIVIIFPDGLIQKVDQHDAMYEGLVTQIQAVNKYFIPYNDDTTAKFYDVIGNNFHTRFQVPSTTTTTTTTIKP